MRSKHYTIITNPVRWTTTALNDNICLNKKQAEQLQYELSLLRDHGDEPCFKGTIGINITFFMQQPKLIKKRTNAVYSEVFPPIESLIEYLLKSIYKTNNITEHKNQIAKIHAEKRFDSNPRIEFEITEIG